MAQEKTTTTSGYIPGGQNVRSAYYDNGGFLPFASKAKFLGTSQGSWYDIGTHIGKACEAMIAASTDYWWTQMCQKKGRAVTMDVPPVQFVQMSIVSAP